MSDINMDINSSNDPNSSNGPLNIDDNKSLNQINSKESDSDCRDTSEPVQAGHVSGEAALANIGILLKISQEDEFEFLHFTISWIFTVYNLTLAPVSLIDMLDIIHSLLTIH